MLEEVTFTWLKDSGDEECWKNYLQELCLTLTPKSIGVKYNYIVKYFGV